MSYTIALVPTERVREAWKEAGKHLKPAIDRSGGRWTTDYVLASLVLNEQSLWVVFGEDQQIHGAITSQICTYPHRKTVTIHFLGGEDFDGWYDQLFSTMVRYAHDMGCDGIECLAREGFWKWFQKNGFEKTAVFYELDIK